MKEAVNSRRLVQLPDGRNVLIAENGWYEFVDDDYQSGEAGSAIKAYGELAGIAAWPGSVELVSTGAPSEILRLILGQQGVSVEQQAPLRIVVTDDYLRPQVASAVQDHPACLLAKSVGRTLWMGPYLRSGDVPCIECLRWWLTLNRYPQNASLFAGAEFAPDYSIARLPSTEALAAGWIATVATLLAAGLPQPQVSGAILHLDTVSQRLTRSVLNARGDCPNCRSPQLTRPAIEDFASRYVGIVSDPSVSRVFGVHVARGRCVLSYPRNRHSVIAPPQVVGGKGRSVAEARAACIGEAIERYSLVYQGDERIVQAAGREIASILPNELLCYSEKQFDERYEEADDSNWIPQRYDPRVAISWVKASSLTGGDPRYIPAEHCYFWTPESETPRVCLADSNGCAGGPDMDAARLSAVLELVERDAASIWWYNQIQRPAVDISSFDDAGVRRIVSFAEEEGWEVNLLDITTEFGIPVLVAGLRHHQNGWFAIGSACHPDPAVAATKALAEAALVEYWSLSSGRKSAVGRWLADITPELHPQVVPRGRVSLPQRMPGLTTGAGLEQCLAVLKREGIECFEVDLTRPETHWPVVRVVAPGLRHFSPRYGAGRLYDVPVRMGWMESANAEEGLERTPLAL